MLRVPKRGNSDPGSPENRDPIRFARLALAAIRREYPFHYVHLAHSDADLRAPGELHPSFGGAFDLHSSVHGHWCVVRALRWGTDASFAAEAREVLTRNLSRERLVREFDYLSAPGREGFERPYGLAWLLQLAAELREWNDVQGRGWLSGLEPLEQLARTRILTWLPNLPWPVRGGEHSQTAFALGLLLDHARTAGDREGPEVIEREARRLFGSDVRAPLHFEPSAHDFLSPALAEADLMRRVLDRPDFTPWLEVFLSAGEHALVRWLEPVRSPDPSDGKFAHLCGLNLSRAWMLEGVGTALDSSSPLARLFESAARRHRDEGLSSVTAEHYAGSHWLGTFATYLVTERGLAQDPARTGRAGDPVR